MSESSGCFPIIDCKGCARTCGVGVVAEFTRRWLSAWAHKKPLPECGEFKEKYWKGQELARW